MVPLPSEYRERKVREAAPWGPRGGETLAFQGLPWGIDTFHFFTATIIAEFQENDLFLYLNTCFLFPLCYHLLEKTEKEIFIAFAYGLVVHHGISISMAFHCFNPGCHAGNCEY